MPPVARPARLAVLLSALALAVPTSLAAQPAAPTAAEGADTRPTIPVSTTPELPAALWPDSIQMSPVSPSLALLDGNDPGPDDLPALIVGDLDWDDSRLDTIPEAACWKGEDPRSCSAYAVPAPPATFPLMDPPRPGTVFLVGPGGLCEPTYGEPLVVAYVRGCNMYFRLVTPLSGCPGPIAPFLLGGTGFPRDVVWIPAVDGPVEQPLGPAVPSDPLHHEVVDQWLATNPIPPGQSVETRALRRLAQAGSESVEGLYAGALIHVDADACNDEVRSLNTTGLRTATGEWRAFNDGRLLSGVLASGGRILVAIMDDAGYVTIFRRIGPMDFSSWFEASYFDENDECQSFGSPVEYPYPCGP